jgi:phosphoribosylformylglycinamidine (FGAM) synthase-like enzyme
MLGLIEDIKHITTVGFKNEGDVIALIGKIGGYSPDVTGGSSYLKYIHGHLGKDAPNISPEAEKNLIGCILELIRSSLVNSAHDISDGGLAVALAESCVLNNGHMGCEISLNINTRADYVLFGEPQSQILISFSPEKTPLVERIVKSNDLEILILGKTGGDKIKINDIINLPTITVSSAYYDSLRTIIESKPLK